MYAYDCSTRDPQTQRHTHGPKETRGTLAGARGSLASGCGVPRADYLLVLLQDSGLGLKGRSHLPPSQLSSVLCAARPPSPAIRCNLALEIRRMWCWALTRIPSYYQLNIFQLEMPPTPLSQCRRCRRGQGREQGTGSQTEACGPPPSPFSGVHYSFGGTEVGRLLSLSLSEPRLTSLQ